MISLIIIFFISFCLPSFFAQTYCSANNSNFYSTALYLPALSPQDEIISGTNFGKLYSFPNGLLMLKSFPVIQSTTLISNSCPFGWVPASKEDLSNLMNFTNSYNKRILFDPALFNLNVSLYYASSTKYYSNITNVSDTKAYLYYTMKFVSGIPYMTTSMSFYDYTKSRVLCSHSMRSINNTVHSESGLKVMGITNKDLIKGLPYTFTIINTNVLAYEWNIDGQYNNSKAINLIPMSYGQYRIQAKSVLFDGTTIGVCLLVWVRNYTGSEANTTLSAQDLHKKTFTDTKLYRSYSLHFTSGSGPLAPIETGGAYILYGNFTKSLFVKAIDNDGNLLYQIDLQRKGYPMDIVSVPWGFIVLIIDYTTNNKLYLLGYDNGSQSVKFTRTLMNNPPNSTTYNTDQIIFFTDATTPMFGMNSMFNPTNGKLILAKDRILAIFARYNFFGYNSDGTRNDHTGDIMISFNQQGYDEKISFSWGASHSLSQNLIYNGENVFSSSLGDAFPLNIRFARNDVNNTNGVKDPKTGLINRLNYTANSNILNGTFPSDGSGFTCGRMGTLSTFGDGAFNSISYSRRPCTMNFEGNLVTNIIDQMGIVFFDNSLNLLSNIRLGSGQWINQVQSAKYGSNIFFAYVTSNRTDSTGQTLTNVISSTDVMSFMLLDISGNKISGPYQLSNSVLPPSDDMRVLNDGRVAWTYVDSNYNLNYFYLTQPLTTITNVQLVMQNGFYRLGDSFYLINVKDNTTYSKGFSYNYSNYGIEDDKSNNHTGNYGTLLRNMVNLLVFSLLIIILL